MSLLSDDQDIRHVRMNIELGGNGDYYLTLYHFDRDIFNKNGELIKSNETISLRVSTSSGNAPHEVKMAIAALYRAMRDAKINGNPFTDENLG